MALNERVDQNWAIELTRSLQRQRSLLVSPCDITININGQIIKAHRSVLAAQNCPKLNEMMRKTNKIELLNLPVSGVVVFFDYLYTGAINLETSNWRDIYQVANFFSLTSLIQLCNEHATTMPEFPLDNTQQNTSTIDFGPRVDLFDILRDDTGESESVRSIPSSIPDLESYADLTQIEPTLTPDPLPLVAGLLDEDRLHWCRKCERTFFGDKDFNAHLDREHKTTSITCNKCGKGFASRKTLSRHSAICQTKSSPPKPRLPCPHCETTFSKKSNLNDHIRRKHADKATTNVKLHKCEKCNKQFTRVTDLRVHLKWHLNIRDYSCHICAESFVTKGALELHLKRHQNDKRYRCELCPASFIHAGGLKRHLMTVHEPKKTLLCSTCGIELASQSALTAHMRTIHPESA